MGLFFSIPEKNNEKMCSIVTIFFSSGQQKEGKILRYKLSPRYFSSLIIVLLKQKKVCCFQATCVNLPFPRQKGQINQQKAGSCHARDHGKKTVSKVR